MKKVIILFFVLLIASAFAPVKMESLATTPVPTTTACRLKSPFHDEWNTVTCETFDSPGNWLVGNNVVNNLNASVTGGKYVVDYNAKNSQGYKTGFALTLPIATAKDYVVSMTGKMDSVYKNCTWGLTIRGTNNSEGYWFSINNMGSYYLTYWGSSRKYIGNLKYGTNKNIRWNEANKMTIQVEGKKMTFYVNEKLIMTYEGKNISSPEISWSIWGAEGVSVVYEFDDILIKEKP